MPFVNRFYFCLKLILLSHNLGSRYARKPIKGSKAADGSLDFKTT